MTKGLWRGLAVLSALATGCVGGGDPDDLDGEGDSFLAPDGKVDGLGIAEDSAEACGVLKLVNEATLERLDDEARLHARAARNIVAYRLGPDGLPWTSDDEWFDSLAELDAVKWVGPAAFARLLAFAQEQGVACGTVPLQILAFSDFHGYLEPPSGSGGRIVTGPNPAVDRVDAGGVEFMATHLRRLRDTSPNTLVVSAGDLIGASPLLSALFHDEPTIEAMELLGLDVSAIGNHEFDEGPEELLRMQFGGCHPVDGCQGGEDFGGAGFEYVAANVTLRETGERLFPPYAIRHFGNVRVGLIGISFERTPSIVTPAAVSTLAFAPEVETANAIAAELRAQGVDTIVLLLHDGGAATGLYNVCEGTSGPLFDMVGQLDEAIDVIIAGHTNGAHVCSVEGRVVMGTANYGRLISDVDLVLDEMTGDVIEARAENVIVTRDVPKASDLTELMERYREISAPLANRVVGSTSCDLNRVADAAGQFPMGAVLADAQLEATRSPELGGAVIALMNPGGVRADIVAAQASGSEAVGEITFGEAFAVQPFGNSLVTLTLTGDQIRRMLEQQWSLLPTGAERQYILLVSAGFSYSFDPRLPIGGRVVPESIMLDGAPIDPAGTYRVTMNGFLAEGGDGLTVLREGTDRLGGAVDLDAFVAYLGTHSPLTAPTLSRVTNLNPPPPPPAP